MWIKGICFGISGEFSGNFFSSLLNVLRVAFNQISTIIAEVSHVENHTWIGFSYPHICLILCLDIPLQTQKSQNELFLSSNSVVLYESYIYFFTSEPLRSFILLSFLLLPVMGSLLFAEYVIGRRWFLLFETNNWGYCLMMLHVNS